MRRHIAVIDLGKTNAKLALVDLADLSEIAVRTRPNRVLSGPPYPHYDLEGHWEFFCQTLRAFHAAYGVDAVSVTTHGAAATLIGADGTALPMLDYEHDGPEELADAYNALRPDFAHTGAPRLPNGLNLGAQLHWQLARDPSLLARIKHIVTYPQYWGYLLTGALACDITSLGCHTDLWLPQEARFSPLVDQLGIRDRMAPPRKPAEQLGVISGAAALATGLPQGLPVAVGIHDSNASLYRHLQARSGPFSIISTGTWVVMMAMRGAPVPLDPNRDTLININALGEPVPSARFMGGRLFDLVTKGFKGAPTPEDRDAVLKRGVMLLPQSDPFAVPSQLDDLRWTTPPQTDGERLVALSYALALITQRGLAMIGAAGPSIVEGPFSRNADYLTMLATLLGDEVEAMGSATGTSGGAALLLSKAPPPAEAGLIFTPDPRLKVYFTSDQRHRP